MTRKEYRLLKQKQRFIDLYLRGKPFESMLDSPIVELIKQKAKWLSVERSNYESYCQEQ